MVMTSHRYAVVSLADECPEPSPEATPFCHRCRELDCERLGFCLVCCNEDGDELGQPCDCCGERLTYATAHVVPNLDGTRQYVCGECLDTDPVTVGDCDRCGGRVDYDHKTRTTECIGQGRDGVMRAEDCPGPHGEAVKQGPEVVSCVGDDEEREVASGA